MPNGPASMASASLSASSACLLAACTPLSGNTARPATEDTFTTVPPPRSRIPGRNAEISRSGPTTLVSNIASATEAGVSSTGAAALTAALFTSRSTGPAASATAVTDTSDVTSKGSRAAAGRPARSSTHRAVATTSSPRPASSATRARPIPRDAPVTSARRIPSPSRPIFRGCR